MEPRIQYAKTSDGVSIAFWTLGEGPALVYMPIPPFSHIQLEWQNPECRRWYERLARRRKLVRYDARGFGLSDRNATDFSVDGQVRDLEAVVHCLGLDTFALFQSSHSGPVAITYAARRPEEVSHLLLWCSIARGADYFESPRARARIDLVSKDWDLYTETTAHALFGWSVGPPARQIAELIRESVTQETLQAEIAAAREFEATHLLPEVRSPTLVLHRRQFAVLDLSVPKGLASGIPGARLVLLEGTSLAPYLGDWEAVASVIDEFLGEGEGLRRVEYTGSPAVHTILFTDIEGSTALTQRLGDARAREVLREHERIVREALLAHGGSEVKTLGDGFMASFGSATRALECAVAMQRAFAERNDGADEPIRVRIGLNAGEPVAEDEDLFGTAVQLAARVCAQAEPAQILASNVVRELAAGKGFLFSDRGDVELRGFEDPVRLYEVRWRGEE